MQRTVYLLHFSKPFGHARHYIGVVRTESVEERLDRHRAGRGAKLTGYAASAGVDLIIARIWPNASFGLETKLKARGGASRLCPICKAQALP